MWTWNNFDVFGVLISWLICGVQCWSDCCRKTWLIYFLNSTLPQGCTRTCFTEDKTTIIDEYGGLFGQYVKYYEANLLTLMNNISFSCLLNCLENEESGVKVFTCTDLCNFKKVSDVSQDKDKSWWTSPTFIWTITGICIIFILICLVIYKRDFFRKHCFKQTNKVIFRDPELAQPFQEVSCPPEA